MKRFLVPTDLTDASRNACRYAAGLALATGADLSLLYVHSPLPATSLVPDDWLLPTSELEALWQHQLLEEAKVAQSILGAEVYSEVMEGSTTNAIANLAREQGADLIVMGVHGGHRNRLWGSTIYETIRATPVAQLVVPETASFRPIKNIVLAADFDTMTSQALFSPLDIFCRHFGAALSVVHVQKPGAPAKASELPQRLQLDRSLAPFHYQYETISFDDVEQGIRQFLHRQPADLLVMVAHPKSLFQRLFGEVHTRSMSFELPVPMLVLKQHLS